MDMDLVPTLINNSHPQLFQTDTMEEVAPFDEQLVDVLFSDDFSYPLSVENNTFDSQWDIGSLFDQIITPPPPYFSDGNHNHNDDNNNNNNNDDDENVQNLVGDKVVQEPRRSKKCKVGKQDESGSEGRPRRKRQATQVQDHILAERKRREVLSHMFISLSSMIPGLKKMDKITILGDAIKHMKVLQEKVKQLEVAAAQLNTSKSTVVVKKYQLSMNVDNNNDNDNDGSSSVLVDVMSASGGNNDDGSNNNNTNNVIKNSSSIPEIQIKILDDTLLLKVFCENRKGILSDLSEVVERHDLSITNYYVIPFQRFTLDITIVAQIEEGFNNNVKGFVRTLQSKLRSG